MERFPISICMAGAVSAGSYSAGAMSVLIEALRRLDDDELDLPHRPVHKIALKGISGASAGSMQAALSALDIFSAKGQDGNYQELGKKAWYESTIDKLLGIEDLESDNEIFSILNSEYLKNNALQRISEHIKLDSIPSFIEGSFQLRFSITNLRGVPYSLSFPEGNSVKFGMSQHNEYVRYSFSSNGEEVANYRNINPLNIRPSDYESLIDGALASGAFPLVFAVKGLDRNRLNGNDIFTNLFVPSLASARESNGAITANYEMLRVSPSWRYQNIHKVYAVDGGVTNNEPLVEAFKILYGDDFWDWEANPADKRGRVIFIDPFPNPVDKEIDKKTTRVDKALGLMLSALIGHARYSPKLIASKEHQNKVGLVYPSLPWKQTASDVDTESVGQFAIKSGALGGFSGFLKKEFMEYDYALGRLNMRRFLRYHFTLDKNNALFENDNDYQVNWDNGEGELPIIPVYVKNSDESYSIFNNPYEQKESYYQEGLKDFTHKYEFSDRNKLSKLLIQRLNVVGTKMIDVHGEAEENRIKQLRGTNVIKTSMMRWGWKFFGAKFLSSSFIRTVENSLYKQGLLNYSLFDEDGDNDSENSIFE